MRKVMGWVKNLIVIMIATILSFESFSFFATKLELFLVNDAPSVYESASNEDYPDIRYGLTERESWGAWHVTNSTFRHSKSCFDITMSFNEVGARDDSFSNLPDSSLLLLGDSFAEGFGVDKKESSEYIIEEKLEVPILNFGTSGSFGPLQQLLIYQQYKKLPHQGLIIYVLPHNDFTDNDQEFWKNIDRTRYRPYFSLESNPLIPYYFTEAVPRDNFLSTQYYGAIKQLIKDYFWSSNALRTVSMLLQGDANYTLVSKNKESIISYFYDASSKQQLNLISAYEAILDIADNKNVLFVIIPSINDIARWKRETDRDRYKVSYWYRSFENFRRRTQQKVEILNLIEHLPSRTDELFFDCDAHWSPQGNAWAAEVVVRFIINRDFFRL